MQRASDLNLFDGKKALGDVIARRTRMAMVFRNAQAVLGLFSRMLLSIPGVSQEVAKCRHEPLTNHRRSPGSVMVLF